MNQPKVTVFMTAYNSENFIERAIKSILDQTFEDFEFIITNDGSADKTEEIIRSFSDRRINLISHPKNLGLVESRNFGLEAARGKYIAIMDADDISIPQRLQKQVAFLDSHPEIGVCGSWIQTFGTAKKYVQKYLTDSEMIKANLLFYTSLAQPSVMIRKEIIEKYHLRYNKENEHCEDYGLWIDISRVSNLMNIPEVLLKYRVHQKGYSKEHRDLGFSDAKKLHKKQIIAFGISPTADELRLHSAFFSEKNESTNNFLVKTESWFLKLHLSNMTAKIYNQQALEKILYERWRTVCGMNAKYGPIVWMTYRTSPLFKLGGWKKYWDSSKILVKCLLRRK